MLVYRGCKPKEDFLMGILGYYRKGVLSSMDSVDIKILNYLKENARQKASSISEEINLSVSAVLERIRKLENSGVIKKYTMVLDRKKIGYDMLAFIEVGLEHPKYYDNFTEEVLRNKQILSCHYITGDFDFILQVLTNSSDGLEAVHREIKSIPGVSTTKTQFVLSTIKEEYTVIPETE